jgi:type IX secretion system PorP/SprF family membrane protein
MKKLVLIIFLFYGSLAFAQGPKFSQYFASPLTLNPALTGYFDGNYRLAINTRQQWANIGDAYNTYSLSGELKLKDELYYNDVFSVGLSALFDESFNKILKSYTYSASFSYYKFLDPDHDFKLGLAPQVSYVSKSLDFDALTVASQFQNGDFNLSLPNTLDLKSTKTSYFDVNVGANLAMSLDRISASLGYSIYHLTRPQESLFNNRNTKIPNRHAINASFRYLSNDLIDMNLSAYYMMEGSSSDQIFGGVIGLKPNLETNVKLNAGLWYKVNENQLFPYVGFEVSNFSMGINYSVFTKNIASYQPRTFELSLILRDKNFTKFKNTCKF